VALPVNGSTHLIPAYYSFYRPRKDERLSWPSWLTCSGWLTHQLQVERRTGKVRRPETDVLPLSHAKTISDKNNNNHISSFQFSLHSSSMWQLTPVIFQAELKTYPTNIFESSSNLNSPQIN